MDDRRMVESAAEYLRTRHPTLARNREEEAVDVVLAALRAEGYDLYRPDDAQRICTCNYTEGIDASDDPTEHNSWCEAISGRRWVPVSEGTEPQ